MNPCAICNGPGTKQCAACFGVFYCSKEHQKQDWKNHKGSCLPYKVARGRTELVATRQLAAGELVLKENPLLSGTGKTSLEQSCSANCFSVTYSTGEVIFRAARAIAPGEHLSFCYADALIGTMERLQSFVRFNTICNCTRCLDPTELGTHFSSLKCRKTGCNGLLIPPNDRLFSDLTLTYKWNLTRPWKCQICHEETSALKVKKLISSVRAALSSVVMTNFAECQDFINRFEPYLHENHYLLTEVRLAATQRTPNRNFTEDDWKVLLKYCQQLDQLLSKLAPSLNKIRGYILVSMCPAVLILKGVNDEETKQVAARAYDLLKHESDLPGNILDALRLQMGYAYACDRQFKD